MKEVDIDSLFHPKGWVKPIDKDCKSCYNYLGSHRCDICKDLQYYQEDKKDERETRNILWDRW